MTKQIEAEGGELVLRNKNGDVAIIPAKHRLEVLDMLKGGCTKCLNDYISTLPKIKDYAASGTLIDGDDPEKLYSASVPPVEIKSTPTGKGRFLLEYEKQYPYKPYTTSNQFLLKYKPERIKLAEESNRREWERKRDNYVKVKTDEEARIANIGRRRMIGGMDITPEQQADIIRDQSLGRLNWMNKDPLQKISKIAGETALAVVPELAFANAGKSANIIDDVVKNTKIRNTVLNKTDDAVEQISNLNMVEATTPQSYPEEDVAYAIEMLRKANIEKNVNKIQNRINNMSYDETRELKRSRMLAREMPDYTNTMKAMLKKIETDVGVRYDDLADDIFTLDPKRRFIESELLDKEIHYPTPNTYTKRIKYPEINAIHDINRSNVSLYPRIRKLEINVGLKDGKEDVTPFNLGTTVNHEIDHFVSHPTVEDVTRYRKVFDFNHIKHRYYTGKRKYSLDNNFMTEIKARLGQLKDLLEKKDLEETSMDELNAALRVLRNPTKFGTINNHLMYSGSDLSVWHYIKDKKELLKLLNDVNTDLRLTPFIQTGIGVGVGSKLLSTQQQK